MTTEREDTDMRTFKTTLLTIAITFGPLAAEALARSSWSHPH